MSGKTGQWGKLRNLTKELLYELYITTGKSTVEISKIFNCDSAAINRKLRKLGIPIRSNSEAHRGIPPWNKGKKMPIEHVEKNRKGHLGKTPWNKGRKSPYPSHRKGVSVKEEYGTARAEEIRKKHRERQYRLLKNPSYLENIIKNCQIITKKLWQNEDYVKKQMKSRGSSPNKSEKKLDKIIMGILPNEYKYVGDGEVIIHGKCPDFININGQKKIIEFYGRYWHPPDDEPNRQFIFSLFGYKTLIVWDNEFNDLEVLREKILEFNKC